jgi:hypothetical protein
MSKPSPLHPRKGDVERTCLIGSFGPRLCKKSFVSALPADVAGIRAPDAIFLESVLLTPRCAR